MAREYVEYIQAQELPWQQCPWPHPGPAAQYKLLSIDDQSGACSVLLRLPPGWASAPGALGVDEELLVLDGGFCLGDRELVEDCYAWLPAGVQRAAGASARGATLLAFYSGRPAAGDVLSDRQARFIDVFDMPWSCDGMDPAYGDAGMRWKILRHDPEAEDVSMLVMAPPHLVPPAWAGPQEQHDCTEEAFVLSGDFLSPLGVMRAGAYFWRPPHILHGPYGTRGGNLSFIRTLGGALENNWSQEELELERAPVRRSIVPPSLAGGLLAWEPPTPY